MEGAGAQDSSEALGTDIPAQPRPLALAPSARPLTVRTQLAGPLQDPPAFLLQLRNIFPRVSCV